MQICLKLAATLLDNRYEMPSELKNILGKPRTRSARPRILPVPANDPIPG